MAIASAIRIRTDHTSNHPHWIRSRPVLKHIYSSTCPKGKLNQAATTHLVLYTLAWVNRSEINDESRVLSTKRKVKSAHSLPAQLHSKADDAVGDQHGHHFLGGAVWGPRVSLYAILPAFPLPAGWNAQLLLQSPQSLHLPHLHHSRCESK